MISRRQIIEQQRLVMGQQDLEAQDADKLARRKLNETPNSTSQKRQEYRQQQASSARLADQQAARQLGKQKLEDYGLQFGAANLVDNDDDHDEDDEAQDDSFGGELEEPRTIGMEDMQSEDYRHFDPYSVYGDEDEEEDIWYSEERLFEEHIQEIVDKWQAIDDEIWAKIICMERNRRIAKAYARKHALTVNGSEDEYLDGTTLGLNSFDNPDRDAKTKHIKQYIGQGLRIKITQSGDILVKRLSKANIFVHKLRQDSTSRRNLMSNASSDPYSEFGDLYGIVGSRPLLQLGRLFKNKAPPNSSDLSSSSSDGPAARFLAANESAVSSWQPRGAKCQQPEESSLSSQVLEHNRLVKVFDMSKFKQALAREARQPIPDRRRLQNQCISVISFVLDDRKMLNLPVWIMVINIVAIDLLKSELGLVEMTYLDSYSNYGNCDPQHQRRLERHLLAESPSILTRQQRLLNGARLGRPSLGPQPKLSQRPFAPNTSGQPIRDDMQLLKVGRRDSPVAELGGVRAGLHQSSSSSGFNSHCSSQNDSSAASSSSNLAAASQRNAAKLQQQPTELKPEGGEQSQPRGKRPPKLPHRISSSKMSEPIAIPAPPTSSGAAPCGKANLILVAPTGISPPLPKRQLARPLGNPKADDQQRLIEFDNIEHIDENGQCKVLLNRNNRLPAGIPPHAQLAPPATQRHILSYLMSATRNNKLPAGAADPQRCQRPLPILPAGRPPARHPGLDKQAESLYYSGMQARPASQPTERRPLRPPPNHQRPMQAPFMLSPAHPITKNAINAILTDFKRNNSAQQPYGAFRPQYSFANLHEPAEQSKSTSKSQQSTSVARPFMKFFRSSKNNNNNNNNNKSDYTSSRAPKFLSMDNLLQNVSFERAQRVNRAA